MGSQKYSQLVIHFWQIEMTCCTHLLGASAGHIVRVVVDQQASHPWLARTVRVSTYVPSRAHTHICIHAHSLETWFQVYVDNACASGFTHTHLHIHIYIYIHIHI